MRRFCLSCVREFIGIHGPWLERVRRRQNDLRDPEAIHEPQRGMPTGRKNSALKETSSGFYERSERDQTGTFGTLIEYLFVNAQG